MTEIERVPATSSPLAPFDARRTTSAFAGGLSMLPWPHFHEPPGIDPEEPPIS